MATLDDLKLLFAEFPRDAISWRAQSLTAAGDKAMALAYIDARDVMDRLDQIVGPDNWQDRYEFHGARTVCYLSIRVGDEWLTKADGAGDSDIEGEKGAISDALKRAAVKWGIGRYLYALESPWVPCETYERAGKKHWKRWTADPWGCVRAPKSEPPRKPNGLPEKGWREDGTRTAFAMKKEQPEMWTEFDRELLECRTGGQLTKMALDWSLKAEKEKWPHDWRELAKEEINKRRIVLLNSAPDDDVFPGDMPANSNSYVNNVLAGE